MQLLWQALEGRGEIVTQRYKIIADYTRVEFITLNPERISKSVTKNIKIAHVRFGIKCCEVKVAESREIEMDEILLSHEIMEELKIPEFLSYEMVFDKNNIIFGPYIGMLAEKKEERLKQIVENLKSYVYGYEEIGGAVLIFSEEGVDMDAQLIRGFVFNPESENWEEGIFAYPAAIFKKTGIRKKMRNQFHSLLGDAIFNSYVFNKWEAHQWLSCFEAVRKYLPDTVLYKQPADVKEFLNQHKSAYIKPIYGSQGTGILKLETKGDWFMLHFSQKGVDKEQCFKTQGELNDFLKNNLKAEGHIVQRTLNLIFTEESTIDFRLMLVKGGEGQWKDIGMIARHGVKGNITSNVSTGGRAEKAELTFKNIIHLSDEEVVSLRNKMSMIAKEAAFGLEKSGVSCGNLGIDMAIDAEGNIWIIEINNINPNHTIAIDAKDRQMFYRARLLNMLYAKRLAGFPKEV
jgi:glutathione synthase/RimK-type ligase-like ATP-grasp enzyme